MNQAPHSKASTAKLVHHKGEKSIAKAYISIEQVMEQPCMHTIAKIKNSMWQACTSYVSRPLRSNLASTEHNKASML